MAVSAQDRAKMAQAATKVEESGHQIKTFQRNLHETRDTMLRGWEGKASIAFTGVFTKFDEAFNTVITELDKIHVKLVDSRVTYTANENAQESDINALGAQINF